ncbi:MAG: branched-chain amino acid ABC transporter permease, partial [Solirubrobacteraceae bacterium]
ARPMSATAPAAPAAPTAAAPPAGPRRGVLIGAWGIVLALVILFPLGITDPTATSIAVFALVSMVAVSSWNIFSGYSGYLSLGHAVFFGSGGYAVALAARDWHVAGGWGVFGLLPFGGIVAGLIAIPVGLIALRIRRHTFVVVTIAIFFIFQLAAFNLGFTGGTSGITLPFAPFSAANYNIPFYYVALIILILTVIVSWSVRRSRFGLQLLAIRDDEDRALGLGVKTRRVKLTAFVISAIPVGMVGGLYFYFVGQVYPQFAFDPLFDVALALMGFLGGMGTIVGPLLGAAVLESLQQYLTQTFSSSATYLIAYGVLFLAVILVMPQGVVPGVSSWLARRRVRAAQQSSSGQESTLPGGVAGAAR